MEDERWGPGNLFGKNVVFVGILVLFLCWRVFGACREADCPGEKCELPTPTRSQPGQMPNNEQLDLWAEELAQAMFNDGSCDHTDKGNLDALLFSEPIVPDDYHDEVSERALARIAHLCAARLTTTPP